MGMRSCFVPVVVVLILIEATGRGDRISYNTWVKDSVDGSSVRSHCIYELIPRIAISSRLSFDDNLISLSRIFPHGNEAINNSNEFRSTVKNLSISRSDGVAHKKAWLLKIKENFAIVHSFSHFSFVKIIYSCEFTLNYICCIFDFFLNASNF